MMRDIQDVKFEPYEKVDEKNFINLSDFFIEHDLKIFKCKNVKSPAKSWAAAGWDFFIPENLSIFDFTKSYKTYLDESIKYDKTINYVIPLIFYLKSKRTFGEFRCKLVLVWNETNKNYVFKITKYDPNDLSLNIVDFNDLDDEIVKWITEDDTVISRIEMEPHSKILIPSGIHANLPDHIFLKAENKSGIASKRGLIFGASVVDTDYQGEIHINLMNVTDNHVIIEAGEKIVQFVPMFQPIMNHVLEYESLDDLYKNKKSDRGAGGFGSSGEK